MATRSTVRASLAVNCLLIFIYGVVATCADDKYPSELTSFVPYGSNPIFTAEGQGHWDIKIRERGWILREGDLWKLWYTGYDGTRAGKKMLGYATSTDGLNWKRYPHNPIYSEHWVEDVCVIPHAGKYYMFAEGEQDRAQLLTSQDGIVWSRAGGLDVRQTNGAPIEEGPFGTPAAWFENGTWNLFYERKDLGVWLARSPDTKVFTNVQDEPVMVPGPDEYDRDLIAFNQIIRYHDRYYVVYHGSKKSPDPNVPNLWSTCLATSTDLIHWEKFPGNPLRPTAENKSSGLLIPDGQRFRLYTMHNEVHVHRSP
jgi:beta-1,2-mannobiose phosphorylase / 1,2-beta-oligomannan phosphorylase